MKLTKQVLSIGVAGLVLAAVFALAFGFAAPAFSTSPLLARLAALQAPAAPGDPIPLESLANLKSLNATVKLDVNGVINDKRAKDSLNVVLATNDQGHSKISVKGGLLGPIAAQVGGSALGLFTPSSVDIYRVPEGAFIVANSLVPICIKPKGTEAADALDQLSPQTLLNMLTGSDVARGKLVGEEKYNGAAVKHYVINGDAFLAAAQKSSDKKLQDFANALWSAEDADLYVDAKGGYPLALKANFSGAYEPLKFQGDLGVQIEITGVNTNTQVKLPAACNKPITP